jgi:biopolymer transport protein ExbD/biopolymer transport protein TolR
MSGLPKTVARVGVAPDINVTPLVDVVLVLLIIFMVVAPRLDQDVQVELPGVYYPDPEVKNQVDPLKVSVARSGDIYVGDEKMDLDGAIAQLAAEHAADPYRRLILRADAGLRYSQVRDLFAKAQEVGFPGIGLQVGERHKVGQEPAPTAPAEAAPADPTPPADAPPAGAS